MSLLARAIRRALASSTSSWAWTRSTCSCSIAISRSTMSSAGRSGGVGACPAGAFDIFWDESACKIDPRAAGLSSTQARESFWVRTHFMSPSSALPAETLLRVGKGPGRARCQLSPAGCTARCREGPGSPGSRGAQLGKFRPVTCQCQEIESTWLNFRLCFLKRCLKLSA